MTDATAATDGGLHGRSAELARIDGLLAAAREGASAALVLRGAPGIGKTALLGHARARADELGFTVLAASGYEGETGLPYATLADLLAAVLALREELPPVQARALGVAFALEEPVPLERFAVPAGVLSLLTRGAEDRPLLAVVDDLHWVDEASREALLFAARRLREEGVALLVATRDEDAVAAELGGLDVLDVGRLELEHAVALVLDTAPDITRTVAVGLAERTAGNPLALREIPALLSAAQRAGSEPLDDLLPLGDDLERAFARRLDALPGPARRALTVAALLEGVDLAALHRALGILGLPDDALAPAERARLVVVRDGQVTFRHPLVRAAVHHLATEAERREAHRALAAASADPFARAWHLAASVHEPDEHVAAELAAVASGSRDRGGHVAAARAWDRAADLTPDPGVAGTRRLAAATSWLDAGHLDRALAALDAIAVAAGAGPSQDDVDRIRARVALRRGQPDQAHALLVAEARRLESSAPAVAAQAMLEAAVAHMMTGDMAALVADARRARELAEAPEAAAIRSMADVLIGEALLAMGQSEEGDALLSASEPFLLEVDPLTVGPEVYAMAGHSSFWIERWGRAERILDRIVGAARAASGFGKLVYPLAARAQMDFRRGAWVRALADADEAVSLARTTGQVALLTHALAILAEVEAGLGRTAAAQEHAGEALAITEALGLQAVRAYALRSAGLDHLAQGRVREAAEILGEATALGRAIGMGTAGLTPFAPDHVEALVRERRVDEAREVLDWFAARAGTGGTWGPAAAARCEGLLAPAGAFDEPFERALSLHAEGQQPFEHARTALLYGERLRRDRRRARAREPLALALEVFSGLGAVPWAERAEQELTAAGGRRATPAVGAAPAGPAAVDELTPAELQVALMVAEGQRNREVASGLFLSEKTVERHLTAIYRKLDLRSRAELAASLAGVLAAPAA